MGSLSTDFYNLSKLGNMHKNILILSNNFYLTSTHFEYTIQISDIPKMSRFEVKKMLYPNIAAERAKRKMSLDSLAQEIGVTRKTIYNWEHTGQIPQYALEKMSDLFNVSIDYLVDQTFTSLQSDFISKDDRQENTSAHGKQSASGVRPTA